VLAAIRLSLIDGDSQVSKHSRHLFDGIETDFCVDGRSLIEYETNDQLFLIAPR
jgi:hypothetical protein